MLSCLKRAKFFHHVQGRHKSIYFYSQIGFNYTAFSPQTVAWILLWVLRDLVTPWDLLGPLGRRNGDTTLGNSRMPAGAPQNAWSLCRGGVIYIFYKETLKNVNFKRIVFFSNTFFFLKVHFYGV